MNLDELQVQIALGTLSKKYEIATIVKTSKDYNVVIWGTKHSSFLVRKGAIKNPLCPISRLMYLAFFDKTDAGHEALSVLETKKDHFKHLMNILEDFPQFKLPLSYNTTENVDLIEESPEDYGARRELVDADKEDRNDKS